MNNEELKQKAEDAANKSYPLYEVKGAHIAWLNQEIYSKHDIFTDGYLQGHQAATSTASVEDEAVRFALEKAKANIECLNQRLQDIGHTGTSFAIVPIDNALTKFKSEQ